jgi:hypothetical protein
MQKLGNARNMYGAYLLDATSAIDTSRGGAEVDTANTLWQQSFSLFTQSAEAFSAAADPVNAALVSCNLGKLMRVGYRAALMRGRIDAMPSPREHQLHDKVGWCSLVCAVLPCPLFQSPSKGPRFVSVLVCFFSDF